MKPDRWAKLIISLSFLMPTCLPAMLSQEPTSASVTTCDTRETCVTISEPAAVSIQDLWKQADMVAIVEILSGDTEHYKSAVYKAKVVQGFKSATVGQHIYIGKFVGYKLGGEYLAFLRRPREALEPVDDKGLNYGKVEAFQIMYEGYSFMPIEYQCIFDGKEIDQQCDYGVTISTNKVLLPRKIKTYPTHTSGGGGEHFMVRKDGFLKWLKQLRLPNETVRNLESK